MDWPQHRILKRLKTDCHNLPWVRGLRRSTALSSVLQQKVAARRLLLPIFYRLQLIYPRPKVCRVPAECYFELREKLVHAFQRGHGPRCNAMYAWLAFINNHAVSEVCCHDKVVLDYECCLLCVKDE